MKKRIVSIFLVLLMLLPALVSCNKDKNQKSGDGLNADVYNTDSDKKIIEYVNDLASEADYSGETFTYYGGQQENLPVEEEETGDLLSDALFYRTRDIEDLFGIDFVNLLGEGSDKVAESVTNEVLSGGDSYDLVFGYVRSVGRPTLNDGVLAEMQDLDHIDIDNEWWNQSMRSFELNGKLYFLLGPINVCNYLDAHVMLFNKSVTATYGISDDDLYQAARDGKWTLDKMFEVAGAVPANTNGNGVYRYDRPGGRAFLFAAGYTITQFDENGTPYVEDKLPEGYSNLSDKIVPVFSDPTQSAFEDPSKKENFNDKYGMNEEELFDNDRALFMFPYTVTIGIMREYDVEFGILPMPKLNEEQENYYCMSESYGTGSTGAVYLPKTARNYDMTGTITEAMAALSNIYVKDAYYEKMLKGQSTYDSDSREMLEIIFANKAYDMADLYCEGNIDQLGPFLELLQKNLSYNNSTFTSDYNAYATVVNKAQIPTLIRILNRG